MTGRKDVDHEPRGAKLVARLDHRLGLQFARERLVVWAFPVTVRNGKRLFGDGTAADGFKLVDSKISITGVIIATYAPAGALKTGSF